jgi:hypothetical protein
MSIRDVQYDTHRQVYLSGQTLLRSLSGGRLRGLICPRLMVRRARTSSDLKSRQKPTARQDYWKYGEPLSQCSRAALA